MSSSWNEPGSSRILDALAGEQLALGVLALDRPLGAGVQRLFLALRQLLDALLHGVLRHSQPMYRPPHGGPNRAGPAAAGATASPLGGRVAA